MSKSLTQYIFILQSFCEPLNFHSTILHMLRSDSRLAFFKRLCSGHSPSLNHLAARLLAAPTLGLQ